MPAEPAVPALPAEPAAPAPPAVPPEPPVPPTPVPPVPPVPPPVPPTEVPPEPEVPAVPPPEPPLVLSESVEEFSPQPANPARAIAHTIKLRGRSCERCALRFGRVDGLPMLSYLRCWLRLGSDWERALLRTGFHRKRVTGRPRGQARNHQRWRVFLSERRRCPIDGAEPQQCITLRYPDLVTWPKSRPDDESPACHEWVLGCEVGRVVPRGHLPVLADRMMRRGPGARCIAAAE